MKILVISLCMAVGLSATNGFAQSENADALVNAGDVLFKLKEDKEEPLQKYREALEIAPNHVRGNYMAGLCYLQSSHKSWSLHYFQKAWEAEPDFIPEIKISSELFPDLSYLLARSFHVGENYSKAQDYYDKFLTQVEQNTVSRTTLHKKEEAVRATNRRIFECQVAENLKMKPLDINITELKSINSPYPDYGPVFSPDGDEMYFTSRRPGPGLPLLDEDKHFFEDIYVARKDEKGRWGNPEPVKELCTPGHESILFISADGKTMIISTGKGNGDLFASRRGHDGKWGRPEDLGKNINTDGHETGASISVKGDKLYFASDREGGFGGLDLYVSERKKNGKWGEAVNLGPRVNTIYDEDSPLINPEGNVLTFSSKGQNTMGGFDVFTSRLDEPSQSFAVPENKGYPLNTVQSDNTYTSAPDGHAYYSSYRENGTGDLDIFVIKQGPPIPEIEQKQREEFKELAKVQAPLMEDRVNQMAKDSTYIQAAEAERQVRTENETMKDMALAETQTPPVATPVKETKAVSTPAKSPAMVQDNSGPASGSKEEDENLPGDFEVMVLEPGSGVEENETGKGYFHYNPETDMEMTRPVKKETILRLLVLDTDTRLPIDGELLFTDQNTREEIRPVRVRNGVYELALTHEVAKDFMISVEKSGFHFKNIMVNVPPAPGNSNLLYTRNIELKKHTLNKPRILRNVYFDFDEASLSERSLFELDMLKKMLEENDRLVIEVAGHADNMGQDKYNLELSRKRAAKVVEYLASKGIDKARLRAQGYGEAKPVPGTDNTASGRSVNRRTEFTILAQ